MESKKDLMEQSARLLCMVRRRPADEHHISWGGHRLCAFFEKEYQHEL